MAYCIIVTPNQWIDDDHRHHIDEVMKPCYCSALQLLGEIRATSVSTPEPPPAPCNTLSSSSLSWFWKKKILCWCLQVPSLLLTSWFPWEVGTLASTGWSGECETFFWNIIQKFILFYILSLYFLAEVVSWGWWDTLFQEWELCRSWYW